MSHIINKFSPSILIAGLIRLISDKSLRNKYVKFLDHSYFCHNMEDQTSLDIKRLVKAIVHLHDAERDKQISLATMEDMMRQNIRSDKDADRFLAQWAVWKEDAKIKEIVKDEPAFNVFVEYLKVIAVAKNVSPFSADYQLGNITLASEKLNLMLSTVRLIEGMSLAESLSDMDIEDLIINREKHDARRFFRMGCPPIDEAIGGFAEQTLNLVIGVTGGGKSATSHHILRTCVETQTYCYVSVLEDRPESFIFKLVAGITGIEISRLRNGPLTDEHKAAIRKAKADINEYVKADFVYGQDVGVIHRLANDYDKQRILEGKPLPLVNIVDYTGHVASKADGDKGFEKMRNAYAERKDYALISKKVCFDFAQVNREGSKRLNDEKILTQNDLAGAFDIAQVCDNIISINRNAMNKTENTAEFHISKARDGITGLTISVGTEFHKARFNMKICSVIQGPPEYSAKYNT